MNASPCDTTPTSSIRCAIPALYFNRELSQLEFNFRVLAQAQDARCRCWSACATCASPAPTSTSSSRSARPPCATRRISACRPRADGLAPATVLNAHPRSRRASWSKRSTTAGTRCCARHSNAAGVRVLGRDSWNAKQTRWLRAYFRDEIMPVLSPLGPGSGASVPEDPQQVAQHRRGAEGQGRVRTRRPPGHRACAALAAAHHPAAGEDFRRRARFRVPVLGAVGVRRRDVPGHGGQGRVPVPRHPQFRADRRRGGSREPRAGAARRTDRPRLPARGAAGDRRRLSRSRSCARCCRTSTCPRTRSIASTARSTSTA